MLPAFVCDSYRLNPRGRRMRKAGGGSGGLGGGSEGSSSSDERGTASTAKRRHFPRISLGRLLRPSPLLARRLLNAATGGGSVAGQQVCELPQSAAFTTNHSSSNGESSPSETTRSQQQSDQQSGRLSDEQTVDPKLNVNITTDPNKSDGTKRLECSLCLNELAPEYFPLLVTCPHKSCYDCLQVYLRIEISESRVPVSCPQCAEAMHPNDIRMILNDKNQYEKYEDFMVRRVLAVEPDTRWCPAPDCSYAVIASGCASCPKIKCEREGCDSYFCYHCKAAWHPNQTCDAARAQRSPNVRSSSLSFSQDSHHRDDIKPCPRCQVLIVKMDDGSCNHISCAVCGAEFCWLCMKEISDLHYLSPSGCTFWGKKPWSRKKKILWQLGTLVGAPVGIGLLAGIAVPAIIIGIPVWVGRKIYTRYKHSNKHKRNLAIAGGVSASVLISPVLAGLAVGIGVPILLFYVYGVVPVSLCRSGGCGVSTSGAGVRFEFDDEQDVMGVLASKANDGDTVSHPGGNPSIGEVSLSLGSGSQLEREADRESASFVALAGSIASNNNTGQRLEVLADVVVCQRFSVSSETASATTSLSDKTDAASTRGLAGSPLNFKTEGGSLSNYRGASNDSSGSAAETTTSTGGSTIAVANEAEPATVNSLEELATRLLRKVTKKSKLSHKDDVEDGCLDRVRFDDNVSFIDPQLEGAHDTTEPIAREDTVVESINESRQRSETSCNSLSDKTQTEDAGHRSSMTSVNFKIESEPSSSTTTPTSSSTNVDDSGTNNYHRRVGGTRKNKFIDSEPNSTTPPATSSSNNAAYWDDNGSNFYRKVGGTRKNKFGPFKEEIEEASTPERVRFDKNVSYIDRQAPSSGSVLHRKHEDGSLTSKSSLRSQFFQQIADEVYTPQPRSTTNLDSPPLLPTIPEPIDSVTVSIQD
ncbi:uncharacterized protein isoform X2 [Rhodnius prolixus]|uniref:uncharacterized protein isoform X2 n=1 Tax=Rhodnius prolixus TaxID=13249 RepID=UPI003D189C92